MCHSIWSLDLEIKTDCMSTSDALLLSDCSGSSLEGSTWWDVRQHNDNNNNNNNKIINDSQAFQLIVARYLLGVPKP